MVQLSNIIRVQNETITLLENVLADKTKISKFSEYVTSGKQKEAEIASLTLQLQQLHREIGFKRAKIDVVTESVETETETESGSDIFLKDNTTSFLIPEDWGLKKECSSKYGEI